MPAPTTADVTAYLGTSPATPQEIANALAAELAAQKRHCRVPSSDAEWPADLVEAVKRRVARNLYMRSLPSGAAVDFTDGMATTVRIGSDPEIRRLEAPWKRLVVA